MRNTLVLYQSHSEPKRNHLSIEKKLSLIRYQDQITYLMDKLLNKQTKKLNKKYQIKVRKIRVGQQGPLVTPLFSKLNRKSLAPFSFFFLPRCLFLLLFTHPRETPKKLSFSLFFFTVLLSLLPSFFETVALFSSLLNQPKQTFSFATLPSPFTRVANLLF